MKKYKCC